MSKKPAKPVTDKKPTDEALATLMLDRQERLERCGKAIEEACKTERVSLIVSGFKINGEGRIAGEIQLVPLD